jgi:hypothetical protein
MRNILGIDPGKSGAIAIVAQKYDVVDVHDIADNITQVIVKIKYWQQHWGIDGVVIEKVSAMPNQGVTSVFSFGEITGLLKGICLGLGIPIVAEPRPSDWKRAVGIVLNPPTKPKNATKEELSAHKAKVAVYKREQKNVSRNRAAELYPDIADKLTRVMDADRAEAVLLAHYGGLK